MEWNCGNRLSILNRIVEFFYPINWNDSKFQRRNSIFINVWIWIRKKGSAVVLKNKISVTIIDKYYRSFWKSISSWISKRNWRGCERIKTYQRGPSSKNPDRKIGKSGRIVGLTIDLASDASCYVTGKSLFVNRAGFLFECSCPRHIWNRAKRE